MFDIGWSELLVIAVVAIIVVGPRDLPRMLRTVGQYVGKARRMAGDFRSQFDDALKEADLGDLKKDVDSIRSLNPAKALRKEMGSLSDIGMDLKKSVESPSTGTPKIADTGAAPSIESQPARSRPANPEQAPAGETTSSPCTLEPVAKKPVKKTRRARPAKKTKPAKNEPISTP